jgi:hypothetical protein
MSLGQVVKHLDVIEHISACFLMIDLGSAPNPLPLEQLEETLRHRIARQLPQQLWLATSLCARRKCASQMLN